MPQVAGKDTSIYIHFNNLSEMNFYKNTIKRGQLTLVSLIYLKPAWVIELNISKAKTSVPLVRMCPATVVTEVTCFFAKSKQDKFALVIRP